MMRREGGRVKEGRAEKKGGVVASLCGAFCSFCGRCGRKFEKELKIAKPQDVPAPGVPDKAKGLVKASMRNRPGRSGSENGG